MYELREFSNQREREREGGRKRERVEAPRGLNISIGHFWIIQLHQSDINISEFTQLFCVQLSFVSFAIATLGSNSREYFAKLENPSVELLERLPNVRPSQFHLVSDLEKFHSFTSSDLQRFIIDLEKFHSFTSYQTWKSLTWDLTRKSLKSDLEFPSFNSLGQCYRYFQIH